MSYSLLRASPWKLIQGPQYLFPIPRISSLGSRPFRSTSITRDLRSDQSSMRLRDLGKLWEESLASDPAAAVEMRFEFYKRLKDEDLSSKAALWGLKVFDAIPRKITRLEDYEFAIDVLTSQKDWHALETLLINLASDRPTYWDKLMMSLLNQRYSVPLEYYLSMLAQSCLKLGIGLNSITRFNELHIIRMLQSFISKYHTDAMLPALSSIAEMNPVLASSLASALMRALTDDIVSTNSPPGPLNAGSYEPDKEKDLATQLWHWKGRAATVTSEDLKVYMMYLIYLRQPEKALSVYDVWPQLHSLAVLTEPVLLASVGTADYDRLQSVFEAVEQDSSLVKMLGSKRYAIVLGALGYLGDEGVLKGIYEGLVSTRPELLSRGVFHALIHSHGVRGDLKKARKMYDVMISRGVEPTYTTFTLMLEAYRGAMDLKGALVFVGKDMVDKYQFGLRSQELTLLLSLCGKRRDYKSAKYLWDWGASTIKPDRIAWNTYLHTFVSANQFDMAWALFREMSLGKLVGIDTLTIMMNAAGRSRELSAYIERILSVKGMLGLQGDEGWYTSLLSALTEWGDLQRFERAFDEMKALKIRPHASHYALYTELLTKTKQFAKYRQISEEMRDLRIPLSFAYIENHFRMLVAPGSTPATQNAAHMAAINLVKDGFFDPKALMVPRGAIPVRVIKPVVRHLVKSAQYVPAKQLLDGLRKQRAAETPIRDDCTLWALYMEVAYASHEYRVIDTFWSEFLSALPMLFALSEPTIHAESVSGPPIRMPVFKVPARYRFGFWKTVDIRINYLAFYREREKLLRLPEELGKLGLALNAHNINTFVPALVEVGEIESAFAMAESARKKFPFNLSNAAKYALAGVVDQVKYHKYGNLGYTIRNLAKQIKA